MDQRTDQDKVKDLNARLSALKTVRLYFEPMVDDILEFVSRSRKINDTTNKGTNTAANVYDGTALGALNLWADGMYGYICSPQLDWFGLKLPNTVEFPGYSTMRKFNRKRLDDVPEVSGWLEDVGSVMRSAFLRGTFYAAMPVFFRAGGGPGTAGMYVEEDIKTGKTIYEPMHFREFWISRDKNGMVNTLFRRRNYNLDQMVEKFGKEKVAKVVDGLDDKLKNNPYEERTVIHAVLPRASFDPSMKDNKNKEWASFWFIEGKNELLLESGYDYFPFIVWGYRRESDEMYARSPAWDAYVEIMLSQQMGKNNLVAGHKLTEPPMVGLNGIRGQVNSGPKGWTWVDQMVDMPKPLVEGIQLPYSVEMQDRIQKIIEKHFNVDFFLMLSAAAYNKIQLTATQVIQMAGEKAAVLATRTDTLNIEAFNPIIDIQFALEAAAGRLPPPPDILYEYADQAIEVDYLGPLAQAQKALFETNGIRAGLELAGQIGSVFPGALKVIDGEETMRIGLKATAFPAKAIRSKEIVAQMNAEEAQQMAMQQGMMQAVEVAKALPGAGKTIEKDSVLGMMAGMGGEAA